MSNGTYATHRLLLSKRGFDRRVINRYRDPVIKQGYIIKVGYLT